MYIFHAYVSTWLVHPNHSTKIELYTPHVSVHIIVYIVGIEGDLPPDESYENEMMLLS